MIEGLIYFFHQYKGTQGLRHENCICNLNSFDELKFYSKASGRIITIYKVIFKLGLISKSIQFKGYKLV